MASRIRREHRRARGISGAGRRSQDQGGGARCGPGAAGPRGGGEGEDHGQDRAVGREAAQVMGEVAMSAIDAESEVASDRLERRWFACMHAANAEARRMRGAARGDGFGRGRRGTLACRAGTLEELRDALAEAIAELAVERRALRGLFQAESERISTAA